MATCLQVLDCGPQGGQAGGSSRPQRTAGGPGVALRQPHTGITALHPHCPSQSKLRRFQLLQKLIEMQSHAVDMFL